MPCSIQRARRSVRISRERLNGASGEQVCSALYTGASRAERRILNNPSSTILTYTLSRIVSESGRRSSLVVRALVISRVYRKKFCGRKTSISLQRLLTLPTTFQESSIASPCMSKEIMGQKPQYFLKFLLILLWNFSRSENPYMHECPSLHNACGCEVLSLPGKWGEKNFSARWLLDM